MPHHQPLRHTDENGQFTPFVGPHCVGVSPSSELPLAGFLGPRDQRGRRDSEGVADHKEGIEGGGLAVVFESADIGAVDPRSESEFFLSHPRRFPRFA